MNIKKRSNLFFIFTFITLIAVLVLAGNTSSEQLDVSEITVVPSSYQVEPGSTFTVAVDLYPAVPVSGVQFDMGYTDPGISVTGISEGDIFSIYGSSTVFELKSDTQSSTSTGTIYSAILDNRSVSESGNVAVLTMIAGDDIGYQTFDLDGIILSDASSNPVSYTAKDAVILIDSTPVLAETGIVQATENKTLDLTLQANDADDDVLSFSATSLPDGASFDTSTGTLLWTPDTTQVGQHSLEVTVTDGYLNDTKVLTIDVFPSDLPPVAYTNGPYVVRAGKKFKFSSTGSYDPDGTIMSYTWDLGDGSTAIGPEPFHTYSTAGVYTVTLTVMDNAGNIGTDVTTVTVENFFKFYLDKFK
ncbi:PKD domain-containing protein [Methanolobus profundi]|uniref:Cohesin domain-containing protein n=1 Tax=Methanolobus profundi TaxID=487685 RepID=A0A1I4PKZ1_9EURY|nr:PKD domain-containing protein [Methanolobus profundi]SFM28266.1 Cohesin domain-containing protein [Methanolobus profundi]